MVTGSRLPPGSRASLALTMHPSLPCRMTQAGCMVFNSIPKLPIRHKACRSSKIFSIVSAVVPPAGRCSRRLQRWQQFTTTSGKSVLCALSGGVDSSVTALLVRRAIGERLTCIFVDNGLLRADEAASGATPRADLWRQLRARRCPRPLHAPIEGGDRPRRQTQAHRLRIYRRLRGGARQRGTFTWLAQGTLYPDVIESIARHGPSVTIKSHHNVGGLPEVMQLKLVEPPRARSRTRCANWRSNWVCPKISPGASRFRPSSGHSDLGEVTEERLTSCVALT